MELNKKTVAYFRELIKSYWVKQFNNNPDLFNKAKVDNLRGFVHHEFAQLPIQTRGHWEKLIKDPNY